MSREEDINYFMGICFKNNIKVYPVVHDKQNLKIEVCYSGRKKTGKELYRLSSDQKKLQNKISFLYKEIAEKIKNR